MRCCTFVILLSLILVACKSNDDKASSKSSTQAPTKAAPQAQPQNPNPNKSSPSLIREPPPPPPDLKAPPEDAKRHESGLVSKVLPPGTGKVHPHPESRVKIRYTGWRQDGRVFASNANDEPLIYLVKTRMKGWAEGMQLMVEGEKRRLWIPVDLAFGENTRPGMPAGALVIDTELLDIVEPLPAPDDVAQPPPSAKVAKSGLVYRVLKKGHGKKNPDSTDELKIRYFAWTPDGEMFDTSAWANDPLTIRPKETFVGLEEALKMMVEGQKIRVWIPTKLGWGDKPPRPGLEAGPTVYDIELVKGP